jgi:hypothetical protein
MYCLKIEKIKSIVFLLLIINLSCYNPPENCEKTFVISGGITDCFDPKLKETNINMCLLNLVSYQKCEKRMKKEGFYL